MSEEDDLAKTRAWSDAMEDLRHALIMRDEAARLRAEKALKEIGYP